MSTQKDVFDGYNTMVSRESVSIRVLSAETDAANDAIGHESNRFENLVSALFPVFDDATLAALTACSNHTDFSAVSAGLARESAANRVAYEAIAGRVGSPDTARRTLGEVHKEAQMISMEAEVAQGFADNIQKFVGPVTAHNQDHPQRQLTDETLKDYPKIDFRKDFRTALKSLWAGLRPSWRSAYEVARTYKPVTTSLANDLAVQKMWVKHAQNDQAKASALEDKILSLRSNIENMDSLNGQYRDPVLNHATVLNLIGGQISADSKFVAALAEKIGSAPVMPLAVSALKIDALQQIEQRLAVPLEQVETVMAQHQRDLPNISKRYYRNAGETSKKDMTQIMPRFERSQAKAAYEAVSAARARQAIDSFVPPEGTTIAGLKTALNLHMAVTHKVDPAYIRTTFGITNGAARQLDVDPRSLRPDILTTLTPADDSDDLLDDVLLVQFMDSIDLDAVPETPAPDPFAGSGDGASGGAGASRDFGSADAPAADEDASGLSGHYNEQSANDADADADAGADQDSDMDADQDADADTSSDDTADNDLGSDDGGSDIPDTPDTDYGSDSGGFDSGGFDPG